MKLNDELNIFIYLKLYLDFKKKLENEIYIKNKLENEIISLKKELANTKDILEKKTKLYENINNINDENLKKISSLFADYLLLQYDYSENYLETKKRPAFTEAKRIKDLKLETKNYIEQYKLMLYKYELLLNIFPEIEIFVEDFDSIKVIENFNYNSDEFDNVQKYLTRKEYLSLSETERNQLALDNYIKGRKSNWEIGRDYELFCGHQYEKRGWNVEYFGIEKRFNDLGRDLIARKENNIHIIQCKYWSKNKLIHEKHILQLFATTHLYQLECKEPNIKISAIFFTNTNLSDTANEFAKKLKIKIVNLKLEEFPRIKCNINGDNKIYHLPFDQKYNQTQIKNKNEFYAMTVKEAVEKGFRRAMKYYG